MSDYRDYNSDFGIAATSFAVSSDDIPQEMWSDHDIAEWYLTRKERAKQEREVQERRARLKDRFDQSTHCSKSNDFKMR